VAWIVGTSAKNQPIKMSEAALRTVQQDGGDTLREQIPLRDMSDCLLALYNEMSRSAFQRCIVRGEQERSDRGDWKTAEADPFARNWVDFEESGGNLCARTTLPGCAGTQNTVARDECWLLICGYREHHRRPHLAEDFGESEDGSADSGDNYCADDIQAISAEERCAVRDRDEAHGNLAALKNEQHDKQGLRAGAGRGHFAWRRCGRG
jgi:hypothetical protein